MHKPISFSEEQRRQLQYTFQAEMETLSDGCWIWRRSVCPILILGGHTYTVARLAYSVFRGDVSGGNIKRTCQRKNCWNPDHLFVPQPKQPYVRKSTLPRPEKPLPPGYDGHPHKYCNWDMNISEQRACPNLARYSSTAMKLFYCSGDPEQRRAKPAQRCFYGDNWEIETEEPITEPELEWGQYIADSARWEKWQTGKLWAQRATQIYNTWY